MPRTIAPILEAAMPNITGDVIIRGFIGYEDGDISVEKDCIRFKLTGTTLEIELEGSETFAGDVESIWLKRGLTIDGVDYTVTTSRFFIETLEFTSYGTTIVKGNIFPNRYTSLAGDDTYENIITNFCTIFGKTAVFKNNTDAYWDYQFLPTGKTIILNNPMRFFNMLRQKYLIFACDYGSEQILFYHAKPLTTPEHTVPIEANYFIKENRETSRQFLWRDEVQTTHTDGNPLHPIHNLGYLESTDNPPDLNSSSSIFQAIISPDLELLDGDTFQANFPNGDSFQCRIFIEEEFNPNGKDPTWKTIIKGNEIFGNTEGGSVPSTIERVSNYTPLNTSGFDNNLDSTINNLQALADAVDNLTLGASYTDEQIQDIVGAMFTGNTETGISVTYDDSDGTIDVVENETGRVQVLFFHSGATTIAASTTRYLYPGRDGLQSVHSGNTLPLPAKVRNLYFRSNSAQPATGSLVCTVQKNLVNTALQATVAAGAGATTATDLVDQISFAAGDVLTIKIQNNATSASAQITYTTLELVFDP